MGNTSIRSRSISQLGKIPLLGKVVGFGKRIKGSISGFFRKGFGIFRRSIDFGKRKIGNIVDFGKRMIRKVFRKQ